MREVSFLRNAMQPVNRLHPEIITLCATLVSDNDPRPIIPLTHVCQYWRRTITSSPGNWASIGSLWKKLVPLCLERAGTVPLTTNILGRQGVRGDKEFLQALVPHISRTFNLSVTWCLPTDNIARSLPDLFDSSMPNLTFLELHQSGEPPHLFQSSDVAQPPLFSEFFKAQVVAFISSILVSCNVQDFHSRRVETCEIRIVRYETPFRFERLLELLHSNKNLESVILDLRFSKVSVPARPEGKVSLSKLRSLSFRCAGTADPRALLSYLSIPRGSHRD